MIFRSKVKCARVFFVFFLVLFFSHNHAMAQANWYFAFGGRIEYTDEKKNKDLGLEGASATLIKGGNVVTTVTTGNNGKFSFKLEPASDYIISLTKAGFITKKFAISTKNVPDDRAVHPFAEWNIEVVIFQQYPGVDYSILNNPIAKIVYNPAKEVDDFDYDKAYTDQVKATLAKLEELARAAAELEKKYSAAMARAEKAFAAKDYTGAKAAYTEASGVKPAEQAPKEKIKECDAQIALAGASAKVDADYKAAMAAGDAAMAAKNYTQAKTSYTQAGTLKPAESAPKDKLKSIEDLLKADAQKAELDKQYTAAIAKGDASFASKDYGGAKASYSSASGLKPAEQYPKDKLKECDNLIAQAGAAAKLDADYQAALKKGDDAVAAKTYDVAKTAYTQAGTLKPTEQTPKDKLKALADLMKAEADKKGLEEKYKAALAKGDAAFGTKDYAGAKAGYVEASGLKPTEQYPKDKIKDCDTQIAQAGAAAKLDADYNAAIKKGDDAVTAKTYDAAKAAYTQAGTLKPAEQTPKDKLKALADLMKAEADKKGLEEKYKAALAKGDASFGTKDYANAKAAYVDASGLKPAEQYPKDRIKECETLIAQAGANAKADAEYQKAVAAGDIAFKAKKWDDAKTAYTSAQTVKPSEAYPKAQLKAIDEAIKAENEKKGLEEKYTNAISKADVAFKAKDYDNAKTGYTEALGYKPTEAYPKAQLKAIDEALKNSLKDKELNAQYLAALKTGDDAFAAKTYDAAKAAYVKASGLKPAEQMPKDKIKAIDDLLKAESLKKGLEEKYKAAIAKGDEAFKGTKYEAAKASFNEALTYKPDEQYPKDKLKELDVLLAKTAGDKLKNENYQKAIAAADIAYKAKKWADAKTGYTAALAIKSEEAYPKAQLAAMEEAIKAEQDKKGLEEKYIAAIAKGDAGFKGKDYDNAKAAYTEAMGYKPAEAYPKAQLKAIEDALKNSLKDKELNEQYLAAIKAGDEAFAAKTYEVAKAAFVKASGLKPTEQMPKDKIKAIDDLLKAELLKKGLEEKYKAAIAKGDEAFKGTKYEAAKASFNEALTYKPDEQYPKDKLKELDILLSKNAGEKLKNENYQKAIAAADIAYKAKKWADAKTGYTAALAIKSEEAYPKAQLVAIEEALKAEQDKKGLEEKYTAAIAKGDAGFKGKDYDNAKLAYTEALGFKPAEAYPKAQLKAIDEAMKADLDKKGKEERYAAAISKGDAAFKTKDFEAAKGGYTEALAIKPLEAYPKAQLKAIEDALKSNLKGKQLEEQYALAIKNGDAAFAAKKYPVASTAFTQASGLKPAEQYPKDKLKELEALMQAEGANAKYTAAVAKGDEALKAKNYEVAKGAFTEASQVKPAEAYPKTKLKELEGLMNEAQTAKEKNARYAAAISKADLAFKAKKLEDAKTGYTEALAVKPEEEYPQGRLKEIEDLLNREKNMKDVEGRYNEAISRGDEGFKTKDWVKAKIGYEDALKAKPSEAYPKSKLEQLAAAIAAEDKLKGQNAKYIKLIQDGDKALTAEDYPLAKTSFTEANGIRPNEMYPKDKLNEINLAMNAKALKEQKEAKYKEAIAKGDGAFAAKEYATARTFYNAAIAVKPADKYCSQKLYEIDNLLQDAQFKQQQEKKYKDAIAKADKLFNTKDWTNAKTAYEEAKGMKPTETYPPLKIAACDVQLNLLKPLIKDKPADVVATAKNALAQKYGEGVTELAEVTEGTCKVLTRIVVHGNDAHQYFQRTYSFGQYFFRDETSINKTIFDAETK